MKLLFIISLFLSLRASAQTDTITNSYVVLPGAFVNKYKTLKVGVNQINIVQTNDGRWVTSANALFEFETQLSEAGVTKANILGRIVKLKRSDFPAIIISAGTTTKTIQ